MFEGLSRQTGRHLLLSDKLLGDGLLYGLSFGLSRLFDGLSDELRVGLVMGGCGALLACLLTGGLTTLRHYTIRLLLARSHILPLQAVLFLDDARARILLRRVGGGYQFTHRLLLDYFADAYEQAAPAAAASQTPQSP